MPIKKTTHTQLEYKFFTLAEVCTQLDLSRNKLISLIRAGDLAAHRFGNAWRVDKRELDNFIARSIAKPRLASEPDAQPETAQSEQKSTPSFEGGIPSAGA